VTTVMKSEVSENAGNFLNSEGNVGFSRRTVLH